MSQKMGENFRDDQPAAAAATCSALNAPLRFLSV